MSERYQYLPTGSCELHTFDGFRIAGEGWYVKEEDHEAEVGQLQRERDEAVELVRAAYPWINRDPCTISYAAWCTKAEAMMNRVDGDPQLTAASNDKLYRWHLPSRDVLNAMYQHKDEIGGFASDSYWSSSENGGCSAWHRFFSNGNQYYSTKCYFYRVRAVRALPSDTTETERVFEYEGVLYQAYPTNAPEAMTWEQAMQWCEALNKPDADSYPWHLPSKEVLNAMYRHKDEIGGFVSNVYWSSSEHNSYNAWLQDFYRGYQYNYSKGSTRQVRAVRALPPDTTETERLFEYDGVVYQAYHLDAIETMSWKDAVQWCKNINTTTTVKRYVTQPLEPWSTEDESELRQHHEEGQDDKT